MSFAAVLAAALSLSLDAFALSLCIGTCRVPPEGAALRVGLACGAFQFFMPFAGWALGIHFFPALFHWGGWIAAALLLIVGGHMVVDAFKDEDCCSRDLTRGWPLVSVALATSIDAMALGLGFAAIGESVMLLAGSAGLFTLFLCFVGVFAGQKAGDRFGSYAQVGGGVVLCLLGLNILRDSLL